MTITCKYCELNSKLELENKSKLLISVPSNLMANRWVPKFSWNICVQSPNFCTNQVYKYIFPCHISTNLLSFLKLCLPYCQKLFAHAPTNRWLAEKICLVGTLLLILHANIQSLQKQYKPLNGITANLDLKPQIICLSKSRVKSNALLSNLELTG